MSSKYHTGRDLFEIFRSQVEKITEHGLKSVEGEIAQKCLDVTVENLLKIENFTVKCSEEVRYVSKLIKDYGYPGTISLDEAINKKLDEHPEVTVEEYADERHEIDNNNVGKKGGPNYPKGPH